MLIILSPAKKLDFKSPWPHDLRTQNRFLKEAEQVVAAMRQLSVEQLADMMKLSPALARLNFDRYRDWHLPFEVNNSRPAVFAFNGDAYQGLDISTFSQEDIHYAQQHLRILSALYGVIRPLDLLQPYRIEMGMRFSFDGYNSLYKFWEQPIAQAIRQDLMNQGDQILVNLASEEYFKVLNPEMEGVTIYNCVFKEFVAGQYKIVSQKAKRARGLMSRFILKHRLTNPEEMKLFDLEGYYFSEKLSTDYNFMFLKG
ncbi:MAG: peroxide stress protein YaaA [Bacteroidales bacterium]|nr:peroxide stress protein YaaA [Bacteroidales bacterium]